MTELLKKALIKAVKKQGIENPMVHLEHPEDNTFGDFSSNTALIYAKQIKKNPKDFARELIDELKNEKIENITSIDIAGPGFINFKIADKYFAQKVLEISKDLKNYGKVSNDKGKQVMVEYTDPNPFKIFHIGHLMANTIGESLSRIVEFSNAKVIRACYQGDVGLHVAKTIWATLKNQQVEMTVKYLGDMYVIGNEKYETDEAAKKEIIDVNKKIFDKSDEKINQLYENGRKLSLAYFDSIYKKLGTKFDHFFFESEVADDGIKIVKEFSKKGIFETSEGATIFPGEKYGEHTRVFISSQGLATYEAKELGLTKKKFELYPDLAESVVVTANEQNAYFKVILAAEKVIAPDIASKMKHLSHGILRPSTGKMSSRKGNVVSADDLIEEFESLVKEKIKDRNFDSETSAKVTRDVAIAGLKYTILRQAIGGDIIYDPTKAISFEGDSGPYLQYATVRAQTILSKADKIGGEIDLPEKVEMLEKLILRFPEVVERARLEYAPNYIVTYLTELASEFNSYYANHKIIESSYRLILTSVFDSVMKSGLWILGIKVPEKM
jgi:arginyl-tRNA synthetase